MATEGSAVVETLPAPPPLYQWSRVNMCRNIKMLFNFEPPVTDDEMRAAALQWVRKISGFSKPSKANEAAFLAAIEEVAGASRRLLRSLETNAPPKSREQEAAKAKARGAERFTRAQAAPV
jgi:hypothetical protein